MKNYYLCQRYIIFYFKKIQNGSEMHDFVFQIQQKCYTLQFQKVLYEVIY